MIFDVGRVRHSVGTGAINFAYTLCILHEARSSNRVPDQDRGTCVCVCVCVCRRCTSLYLCIEGNGLRGFPSERQGKGAPVGLTGYALDVVELGGVTGRGRAGASERVVSERTGLRDT